LGTHLHFDCYSGISGDMILGALVDVGLPFNELVNGLKRLPIGGFRLRKRRVRRGAVHATKIDVLVDRAHHHPLSLSDIHNMLTRSRLPDPVITKSLEVFDRLAAAEGKAHRVKPAHVHFHEVGVLDSFVDVVGGLLGCHLLGVTRVSASPINVGSGTISTSHGLLPVPGPAVAALVEGLPIYSAGPSCELATPTGVALLRSLTTEFGGMPVLTPTAVGYGTGDRDPDDWPNALRVFLSRQPAPTGQEVDSVMQLETNLDDLNPQAYEHVMQQLLKQGALDVTLAPVVMKRGRPGTVVTCLVAPGLMEPVLDVLFRETTALGVRVQEVQRRILPRRVVRVKIRGGSVRIKIGAIEPTVSKAAPEYLDCKRIAEATGRPLKSVMEEAAVAYAKTAKSRKGPA